MPGVWPSRKLNPIERVNKFWLSGKKSYILSFVLAFVVIGFIATNMQSRIFFEDVGSGNVEDCKHCNVILVHLDTLRADHLPCLGYEKDTMPHLCEFAGKSVLFENHYVTASFTLPSTASVFTSLLPTQHGVKAVFRDEVPPGVKTLAETLQENGYNTWWGATIQTAYLPLTKGFERGFEHITTEHETDLPRKWEKTISDASKDQKPFFVYLQSFEVHQPYAPENKTSYERFNGGKDDPFLMTVTEFYERFNLNLVTRFNQELSSLVDEEFKKDHKEIFENPKANPSEYAFLITSYVDSKNDAYLSDKVHKLEEDTQKTTRWGDFGMIDSHDPNIPQKYKDLMKVLYDSMMYELDQNFQSMITQLQQLDLLKNTIIVIYSDHGEAFDEHGEGMDHSNGLYQPIIHTPLIVYVPGMTPRRVSENVTSLDIFPTILQLTGIDKLEQVDGLGLKKLMVGENTEIFKDRLIVSEHNFDDSSQPFKRSVIIGKWKLLKSVVGQKSYYELYDLSKDPLEKTNLANEDASKFVIKEMDDKLESYMNGLRAYAIQKQFPDWVNEETRQRIIKSGYF